MIKSLFALLLTLALLLPTSASAQSTTPYRFYAIVDGNGNGYGDASGNDMCISTTLRVKRIANNPMGALLVVPVTNNSGGTFMTNNNMLIACINNSSLTYNLYSREWYSLASNDYPATYTWKTLINPTTYYIKEYNAHY